jgi:hypothetical protein
VPSSCQLPSVLGTIPAWVSAASVIFAALTYKLTVSTKEKEQAAKVTAWLSSEGDGRKRITLSNFSDSPAFDLSLPEGGKYASQQELSPKSYIVFTEDGEYEYTANGKEIRVRDAMKLEKAIFHQKGRPRLTFKDAVGREWTTDSTGKPRRNRRGRR